MKTKTKVPMEEAPVDRAARDALAERIEAFLDRRVTAFEFDQGVEEAMCSDDPVVSNLGDQCWFHYDDIHDHYARLTPEEWNLLQRMLLVLRSDARVRVIESRTPSPEPDPLLWPFEWLGDLRKVRSSVPAFRKRRWSPAMAEEKKAPQRTMMRVLGTSGCLAGLFALFAIPSLLFGSDVVLIVIAALVALLIAAGFVLNKRSPKHCDIRVVPA